MKSALAIDRELVKEFGISEDAELDPMFKLSYVRTQIDEFKKVMYRNIVDAIISKDLIERAQKESNESLETKGRENLGQYRNVIKQMASAIEVMEQLKRELEPLVGSAAAEQ